MRLNIKLSYEAAYDCFENLIPPIARWYGKDYELMSMHSWGFRYRPSPKNHGELFSRSFDSGTYPNLEYLGKFHGIQLIHHTKLCFDSMINIIKSELDTQKPVIIFNDLYWCPWYTSRYKIMHGGHYCLAIGYEDDGIYVIDSQYASDGALLPFDDFRMGFGDFFLCNSLEVYEKEFDWKELLRSSIADSTMFSGPNNMFDALKLFSNDILDKLNLIDEMKEYQDIPSASGIVSKLASIGKKRKQYSLALSFLSKKYQIFDLDILSRKFIELSNKWSMIFGLLIKAYYTNSDSILLKRMADKINKLAYAEETILGEIRDVCNDFQCFTSSEIDSDLSISNFDISECSHIDLANYANNKGFGYDLNPNNLSEFSDGGRYIYIDNAIGCDEIDVDGVSFLILGNNERYDNISSKGQTIPVNLKPQKYIMFLGCSEWGSHTDKVELFFKDGEIEEISIELSNIASTAPAFGERMITMGRYVFKRKTAVDLTPFRANLFLKVHSIRSSKAIEQLKLPYYPNIHIFAISFGI